MDFNSLSVDSIFFLIVFIVAFFSFLKGFIRDFLGTLNLIIAFFASYFFSPFVAEFVVHVGAPVIISDLSARFLIFVGVLIIGSVINHKVAYPLTKSIPSSIDSSLGFGFGFLKAYLITALIFAFVISFYDKSSMESGKIGPKWLLGSKTYDILMFAAKPLEPIVDNVLLNIKGKVDKENLEKETQEGINQIIEEEEKDILPQYDVEEIPNLQEGDDQGYSPEELQKLNRLIELMEAQE